MRVSSVGRSRGRSERPVPRLSNRIRREKDVIRRQKSTKIGCSHAQTRLIRNGTNSTSTGPSPTTWYAMLTSPLRA